MLNTFAFEMSYIILTVLGFYIAILIIFAHPVRWAVTVYANIFAMIQLIFLVIGTLNGVYLVWIPSCLLLVLHIIIMAVISDWLCYREVDSTQS